MVLENSLNDGGVTINCGEEKINMVEEVSYGICSIRGMISPRMIAGVVLSK